MDEIVLTVGIGVNSAKKMAAMAAAGKK